MQTADWLQTDCRLTADHCFQCYKTMGLLLSRSHLNGEDNGLQQSAVCILWLTDVKFIKLTTSLRQRQNLRVSLWILTGFFLCWGNHCWLPILLIFLSVIFQKKETLLRGNTTLSGHGLGSFWGFSLATTNSCKNVETLWQKNNLSYFKSLLVTRLLDILHTSLLPSFQSCSSEFVEHVLVLLSTLILGEGGGGSQAEGHKQVSRAKIRNIVSSIFATGCGFFWFYYWLLVPLPLNSLWISDNNGNSAS